MTNLLRLFLAAVLAGISLPASAEHIRDLVTIQGVRENQLIGYGLVVGLDGSGDQTTQTPFTVQSVVNMLTALGVNLPAAVISNMQMKNVAAVMVTANLPPFVHSGDTIDVTASSIGNAKSLRGGTLLMTPLKGADGQLYAIAQGNMLVGGAGASGSGAKVQINQLNVGRIPGGATVERTVPTSFGEGEYVNLELRDMNFTTAMRIADTINQDLGSVGPMARALDGRTIQVRAPTGADRVAFVSKIENLQVEPAAAPARVIINARTGSVVMNQDVTLDDCAVAHGNLTVVINTEQTVSQPNAMSEGRTAITRQASIDINAEKGSLLRLKRGVSLNEVVKALNSIGATPQDLLAILQAMKSAGALHAELEII
jgi:flagellar P-ring protein precursor FlgI